MAEILDGQPLFPGSSDIDQLDIIQRLIGSITHSQRKTLKKNGRNIDRNIKYGNSRKTLYKRFRNVASKEAIDFMVYLLEIDPKLRPTADEALNHPYLSKLNEQNDTSSSKEIHRNRNEKAVSDSSMSFCGIKENSDNSNNNTVIADIATISPPSISYDFNHHKSMKEPSLRSSKNSSDASEIFEEDSLVKSYENHHESKINSGDYNSDADEDYDDSDFEDENENCLSPSSKENSLKSSKLNTTEDNLHRIETKNRQVDFVSPIKRKTTKKKKSSKIHNKSRNNARHYSANYEKAGDFTPEENVVMNDGATNVDASNFTVMKFGNSDKIEMSARKRQFRNYIEPSGGNGYNDSSSNGTQSTYLKPVAPSSHKKSSTSSYNHRRNGKKKKNRVVANKSIQQHNYNNNNNVSSCTSDYNSTLDINTDAASSMKTKIPVYHKTSNRKYEQEINHRQYKMNTNRRTFEDCSDNVKILSPSIHKFGTSLKEQQHKYKNDTNVGVDGGTSSWRGAMQHSTGKRHQSKYYSNNDSTDRGFGVGLPDLHQHYKRHDASASNINIKTNHNKSRRNNYHHRKIKYSKPTNLKEFSLKKSPYQSSRLHQQTKTLQNYSNHHHNHDKNAKYNSSRSYPTNHEQSADHSNNYINNKKKVLYYTERVGRNNDFKSATMTKLPSIKQRKMKRKHASNRNNIKGKTVGGYYNENSDNNNNNSSNIGTRSNGKKEMMNHMKVKQSVSPWTNFR